MSLPTHPVEQFVEWFLVKLRHDEALFRRRGLAEPAALVGSIADELEGEATRRLDEPLTLREAAETSGYSYGSLEHMVRQGVLPNAGEKGRPRVRRRDLPRKPSGHRSGINANAPASDRSGSPSDPLLDLIENEILAMESECHDPDLGLPSHET